jgi:hypothetical protein
MSFHSQRAFLTAKKIWDDYFINLRRREKKKPSIGRTISHRRCKFNQAPANGDTDFGIEKSLPNASSTLDAATSD